MLTGHKGRIGCLVVTPDGQTVISGAADSRIRLWDLASGQTKQTLAGHRGEVLDLALSPDGQLIASASHDSDVRLWQIDGALLTVLTLHKKPITAVSFSADGQLLASKSADDTVRLWRTSDWETVAILEEPHSKFAFSGLAFHPSQPTLATLGDKDKVIRVWDLDTAQWL